MNSSLLQDLHPHGFIEEVGFPLKQGMDIPIVPLGAGERGGFQNELGSLNKGDTKGRMLQQVCFKVCPPKSRSVPRDTACSRVHCLLCTAFPWSLLWSGSKDSVGFMPETKQQTLVIFLYSGGQYYPLPLWAGFAFQKLISWSVEK